MDSSHWTRRGHGRVCVAEHPLSSRWAAVSDQIAPARYEMRVRRLPADHDAVPRCSCRSIGCGPLVSNPDSMKPVLRATAREAWLSGSINATNLLTPTVFEKYC